MLSKMIDAMRTYINTTEYRSALAHLLSVGFLWAMVLLMVLGFLFNIHTMLFIPLLTLIIIGFIIIKYDL